VGKVREEVQGQIWGRRKKDLDVRGINKFFRTHPEKRNRRERRTAGSQVSGIPEKEEEGVVPASGAYQYTRGWSGRTVEDLTLNQTKQSVKL